MKKPLAYADWASHTIAWQIIKAVSPVQHWLTPPKLIAIGTCFNLKMGLYLRHDLNLTYSMPDCLDKVRECGFSMTPCFTTCRLEKRNDKMFSSINGK